MPKVPDKGTTPDEASNAPKKILVIDDERSIRRLLGVALEAAQRFEVFVAEDGMKARDILQERNFDIDCALVDLNMPGIGGEMLLEWMKTEAPHIAAVIITGNREDAVMFRCLSKGANDFLHKPFKMEEVIAAVDRAIYRQAKINEKQGDLQAENPTSDWVEITAPSEMEYLSRMQRFSDLLFASKLPKQVCEDLRMTIEELGRNAIEWGNRFDREKLFHISYCIFPDRIVLKFEDEGEGFIPENLPNPTLDPVGHIRKRTAEGKRPGGFGVFLIQKVMDEVVYSQRGNIVIMSKLLPKK